MYVVIRVAAANSDDHSICSGRRTLLGETDQISIPIVIRAYRKVHMEVRVPTKLPSLGTVEAHKRALVVCIRIPLSKWCELLRITLALSGCSPSSI